MRKTTTILAALLLMGAVVWFVLHGGQGRRDDAFLAMGGIPVRVSVDGRDAREFAGDLAAAASRVETLEDVFSRHRPDSELARLNRRGRGCVDGLSEELMEVMRRSRHWHEASGGVFDITVGPLIDLWHEAAAAGRLPDAAAMERVRARVGMGHVSLDGRRLCLDVDGMSIDLGGIAKGAILDGAAAVLRGRGVARGIIDAGGDVIAFGEGTFKIGIVHPRRKGELMAVLDMPAGAVVTSGDYERFATIGGKRFSHIIDPRTGMPADALISVTVVGPNATDADALATALSVMGREAAITMIERLPDFGAILVEPASDGEFTIWCSAEFKDALTFDDVGEADVRLFGGLL